MAMLAAPRRKQKVINLRAKSNAWSNDANKFGQRMLEKMGWSEGKGLGANENGIVEHVVARYKNDDKGLGYDDRSDQWTKHEDDFNSLLANLSNGDVNEEKLHSGVSLEVKSKKSRARVHYHKFTRGKDLTRYSEKDLANIFGKKSLKLVEPQQQVETEQEDIKTTEQVFTDKGSMVDYFKNKLVTLKSKNNVSMNNTMNCDDNMSDFAFNGFSQATNDNKDVKNQPQYQEIPFIKSDKNKIEKEYTEVKHISVDETEKPKKKKKIKHGDSQIDNAVGKQSDCGENIGETVSTKIDNTSVESIKKTKKKKTKKCDVHVDYVLDEKLNQESSENVVDGIVIKKSKKKKCKINSEVPVEESIDFKKSEKRKKVIESVEDNVSENYVPKKKKKRKDK